MRETRDLAITFITSGVLLLSVACLTQCSAPPPRPSQEGGAVTGREEEESRKPKSDREHDEDEGQEEREKIQRVGRALQTIGANPEMRKTYAIPR